MSDPVKLLADYFGEFSPNSRDGLFVMAILVVMICTIFMTFYLVRHFEFIRQDPCSYCANTYNISCYDFNKWVVILPETDQKLKNNMDFFNNWSVEGGG